MSAESVTLEKWLSAFFDRVDSSRLTKGQRLFNQNLLIGFEEGASEIEAMVHGSRLYKVKLYYDEADLMALGLPDPNKLVCTCSCLDEVAICEHSVCTVLYWAFQTEKALRHVAGAPKSTERKMKTDLTLKRLEQAAQSTPGPFDHVLKAPQGFADQNGHPLDGLMKEVYQKVSNPSRK
ncbi:MAG TPA: hypothetical protein VFH42_05020 [Sporolactobacillaceae bacterium]|nr:hypothetical protein [Sporolactobacillaceae bacterium]